MAFHCAAFLSGLAYLGLCLLVAGVTEPTLAVAQSGRDDHRPHLAGLASLAALLCIPPGALPAFVSLEWSGAAALLCLAVSLSLSPGWRSGQHMPLLRLSLALAACAWYARQRGVPGDILSLDTYVAMPLAGAAEGTAVLAFILLAMGALPLPGRAPALTGMAVLAHNLRHLAELGIWVCLFLPEGLAHALALADLPGLIVDFLYFWGKILMLRCALHLGAAALPPLPLRMPAPQTLLSLAGMVLLIC